MSSRYQVEHKSYRDALNGLTRLKDGGRVNAKEVKAKEKAVLEVGTKLDVMYTQMAELKEDNQDARALLKSLADLGLQIDKISGAWSPTPRWAS